MTRVLVTGAEGFVGRRLVPRLLERGVTVIACHGPDIAPADPWISTPPPARCDRVELDICDHGAVDQVLGEHAPDAVVHLAGLSDVGASWQRIDDYYHVNVEGTEFVAAAARTLPGPCRLIVASSAEVYGRVPESELPAEEDRPLRPRSPYAMTKASVERLTLDGGAIAVRSFNLIGPGQSAQFALPSFASQLAEIEAGRKEPALRVGNLTSRRDFVHVDDGADAYAILVERGEPGSAYNVARGEAIELAAALRRLIEISGVTTEVLEDPDRLRPADVPVLCGDGSRLRALGWSPRRSFDKALEAIWEDARAALAGPVGPLQGE